MALGAEAEAVRALMTAGVPGKLIEPARRTLTIEEHDDGDSLRAKVAEVKNDLPGLFGEAVTRAPYSQYPDGSHGAGDVDGRRSKRGPGEVPQLPDTAA